MGAVRRVVLVVDDDADWVHLIAEALSDEGYAVCTATDGRAACASVRRARPRVVVSDVRMPGMNGCELLDWLRSFDQTLPVIVVTAEDACEVGAALNAAFRVIRKPVSADAIVSAVGEAAMVPRRAGLGKVAREVLAVAGAAGRQGRALLSRTAERVGSAGGTRRMAPSRRSRRGRLALVAGFSVAAVAAIVVAGVRGLIA